MQSVTVGSDPLDESRRLVRERRARVTVPRVRVLAELLTAGRALTHQEVQRRVEASADSEHIDRVTLYRVLEWLVDVGLAHRVAGPDRVFRFSAQRTAVGAHGHFRCTRCERMYCMTESSGMGRLVGSILPVGFTSEAIELTVSGRCADCAAGTQPPA